MFLKSNVHARIMGELSKLNAQHLLESAMQLLLTQLSIVFAQLAILSFFLQFI